MITNPYLKLQSSSFWTMSYDFSELSSYYEKKLQIYYTVVKFRECLFIESLGIEQLLGLPIKI